MTKQEYVEMCERLAEKEKATITESHAYKSIGRPDSDCSSISLTPHAAAELSAAIEAELRDDVVASELSWSLSHIMDR